MRPRAGWLPLLLVLLIIGIPALEIWLIFQVGQQIGVLPTLAVLVISAIGGSLLLRHEGRRTWRALSNAFASGRMPTGELADAALILVGGVLLILPGFATDLVGFLFLLPITRPYARRVLAFFVARRISRIGWDPRTWGGSPLRSGQDGDGTATGEVIEGETVETPADTNKPTIIREIDGQAGTPKG